MDQICVVKHHKYMTTEWDITSASFRWRSPIHAIYSTVLLFILYLICIYSTLPLSLVNRAWRQKNLHWRLWIWHHLVVYLTRNNAVTTIQNHQIIVQNMPLSKTVNFGYTPINIIHRMGTVTLLHSSIFPALRSFITCLHSTLYTLHNLPAVQVKDFQVIRDHKKNKTCTMVVMAVFRCSPLYSFHGKSRYLQVHRECLQDHQEII